MIIKILLHEMNLTYYVTLKHLYKLLSSKAISVGILGIGFLFIFSIDLAALTLFLVTVLAVPFSVYMLLVLYKYGKTKWVIGFVVWMSISFIPLLFMSGDSLLFIALKFSPLLFFVLYTILLKEKTGVWLLEIDFEEEVNTHIHQNGIS